MKEDSGNAIDLEEILNSSNDGTLDNTGTHLEDEIPIEPIHNSLALLWSSRVSMPPKFYSFHITTNRDMFISDNTLLNLDESNNYKEAMVGPMAAKCEAFSPCMIIKYATWLIMYTVER